ncbi:MAG: flagellar basal body rod C-terminal domain-containing protein [Sneathiella sp.]
MLSIAGSALSGLQAASKTVEASARNVANYGTVGTPGAESSGKAYDAVEAVQTSSADGSPTVTIRERNPATVIAYAPQNPLANEDGLIEVPNVDLAEEIVTQQLALHSYKANLKMFEIWDDMQQAVLDIKT